MRTLRTSYRRTSYRHGVGFIWFTLIAMPVLLLAMAFSADFTRIIMTGHAMSNATDAAAIAAAWEFQPGTLVLDRSRATRAARETFCAAAGQVGGQEAVPERSSAEDCDEPISVDVTFSDYTSADTATRPGRGYTTVAVTGRYQVTGTIFFAYFGGDREFEAPPVTQRASVCLPGDATNYTGGFCARPLLVD